MKKVYTILKTREVARYKKISADSLQEAIEKFDEINKIESFDVPCDWEYQGNEGTYNLSTNHNGDEVNWRGFYIRNAERRLNQYTEENMNKYIAYTQDKGIKSFIGNQLDFGTHPIIELISYNKSGKIIFISKHGKAIADYIESKGFKVTVSRIKEVN